MSQGILLANCQAHARDLVILPMETREQRQTSESKEARRSSSEKASHVNELPGLIGKLPCAVRVL